MSYMTRSEISEYHRVVDFICNKLVISLDEWNELSPKDRSEMVQQARKEFQADMGAAHTER